MTPADWNFVKTMIRSQIWYFSHKNLWLTRFAKYIRVLLEILDYKVQLRHEFGTQKGFLAGFCSENFAQKIQKFASWGEISSEEH